MAVRTFTSL
ncbi:hypothetical protein YPPY90_3983, partial [Yersinia pestis PY-90]